VWHARRCLEICEVNGIGDWDLAFAYEALARAWRVAGDRDQAARFLLQAKAAGSGSRTARTVSSERGPCDHRRLSGGAVRCEARRDLDKLSSDARWARSGRSMEAWLA
jgi:hypothetical protein